MWVWQSFRSRVQRFQSCSEKADAGFFADIWWGSSVTLPGGETKTAYRMFIIKSTMLLSTLCLYLYFVKLHTQKYVHPGQTNMTDRCFSPSAHLVYNMLYINIYYMHKGNDKQCLRRFAVVENQQSTCGWKQWWKDQVNPQTSGFRQ